MRKHSQLFSVTSFIKGSGFSCLGFIGLCFLISVTHTYAQTTDSESDNSESLIQTTDAASSENGSENDSDNGSENLDSESLQAVTNESDSVFDIDVLIKRMKGTDAIGVISKLSLKNQVDDLLEQASEIKTNETTEDISERKTVLREKFEGLILKTVTLLNKGEDFILAEDIYLAREELWKSIMENKA